MLMNAQTKPEDSKEEVKMEEVEMVKKPSLEMARTTQAYWDGYAPKYALAELTNY